MPEKCGAIICAAGSGSRMRSARPKQYLTLHGWPILARSVSPFHQHPEIELIVIVAPERWMAATTRLLAEYDLGKKCEVIAGGIRRQDSVEKGLKHIGDRADIVLVHDGARPLVSETIISNCINTIRTCGTAVTAIPVKDTLKRTDENGTITATVDRNNLWQAQTPQGARTKDLRKAFAGSKNAEVTDEAMLLEMAGYSVQLVMGSEKNIKITRPEDLTLAEGMLMHKQPHFRIGHGFDAHRFSEDRPLILGGIEIDHDKGLAGHSDADVLTHALCDAILGALGKGDIGTHFPDSSAEFKDIYSIKLLKRISLLMQQAGYEIGNCDITVICQKPKLAPFINSMKAIIAEALATTVDMINIKATTTEKMGYTGREEGIGCHAVASITKSQAPL